MNRLNRNIVIVGISFILFPELLPQYFRADHLHEREDDQVDAGNEEGNHGSNL
jgi:hypothetical protein